MDFLASSSGRSDVWRNAQVFYRKCKYMLFFFARDDDDDDGQYMILPFRLVNSLSLFLGPFFDSFFFLFVLIRLQYNNVIRPK